MRGADARALAPLVEEVLRDPEAIGGGLTRVVQDMLQAIPRDLANIPTREEFLGGLHVDLEPLRLNWLRIQASITTNNSSHFQMTTNRAPGGELLGSAPAGLHLLDKLWVRMNRIIQHTRRVDRIESDLATHALLPELWWYVVGRCCDWFMRCSQSCGDVVMNEYVGGQ